MGSVELIISTIGALLFLSGLGDSAGHFTSPDLSSLLRKTGLRICTGYLQDYSEDQIAEGKTQISAVN